MAEKVLLVRFILLYLFLLLLSACSSTRHAGRFYAKNLKKEIERSPVFANSFTGFTLFDPETGRMLCDINGNHQFTPASNTKILTLYTCLKVLGDSVPGIKWYTTEDTLFFRGIGDPTFLHPEFQAWQAVWTFLQTEKRALIHLTQMPDYQERFGPGWAWDDYPEAYSTEKNAMPAYGNVAIFEKEKGGKIKVISPPGLNDLTEIQEPGLKKAEWSRAETENLFYARYDTTYTDSIAFKVAIPLHMGKYGEPLFQGFSDLPFTSRSVPSYPAADWHTTYSLPVDTVYRRLMYQSDNFIAEQMLLVCAGVAFDTLQQPKIIRWMMDSVLQDLPQKPRWVDGSGLSRYNLNSPQNNVEVLRRLWTEFPHERILSYFPAGGQAGTIADFYKGPEGKPYVFAKSGSMSGVQCLSGYIVAKHGRVLIFSFMHNNFVGSGRPWRVEMQRILEQVWRGSSGKN